MTTSVIINPFYAASKARSAHAGDFTDSGEVDDTRTHNVAIGK